MPRDEGGPVTGILTGDGRGQTEEKAPEDGDRYWKDAATSAGMPGVSRNLKRQIRPSLGASGGSSALRHLISVFWSPSQGGWVFAVLSLCGHLSCKLQEADTAGEQLPALI